MTDLSLLMQASSAGELTLTEDAARSCAAACDSYVAGLNAMIDDAQFNERANGFGTLRSGAALGDKFSQLLVGGGETLSLVDVLTQHIDVATRLKAVFLKAGADYARTEHENTLLIARAGG